VGSRKKGNGPRVSAEAAAIRGRNRGCQGVGAVAASGVTASGVAVIGAGARGAGACGATDTGGTTTGAGRMALVGPGMAE
jgi:hypothetical protein